MLVTFQGDGDASKVTSFGKPLLAALPLVTNQGGVGVLRKGARNTDLSVGSLPGSKSREAVFLKLNRIAQPLDERRQNSGSARALLDSRRCAMVPLPGCCASLAGIVPAAATLPAE